MKGSGKCHTVNTVWFSHAEVCGDCDHLKGTWAKHTIIEAIAAYTHRVPPIKIIQTSCVKPETLGMACKHIYKPVKTLLSCMYKDSRKKWWDSQNAHCRFLRERGGVMHGLVFNRETKACGCLVGRYKNNTTVTVMIILEVSHYFGCACFPSQTRRKVKLYFKETKVVLCFKRWATEKILLTRLFY